MVIALTTNQTTTVVLEADLELPPEQQTEFDLAPLTVSQRQQVVADIGGSREVQALILAARASLRGWRKLCTADGTEVPYKTSRQTIGGSIGSYITDAAFDVLALDTIAELASKVLEVSGLSDADKGN